MLVEKPERNNLKDLGLKGLGLSSLSTLLIRMMKKYGANPLSIFIWFGMATSGLM
jgi:hypothetical protein